MNKTLPEIIYLDGKFPLREDIKQSAVLAVCEDSIANATAWASGNGRGYLSYRMRGEWHDRRIEECCDMDVFSDAALFRRYQIERQRLVQAGKLKARYATDFASYSACGSSCVGWWL